MKYIITPVVTHFRHEDLVSLLSAVAYVNIDIDIPTEYREISRKGKHDCIEDTWANVLLNGGSLDVYDNYSCTTCEEYSEYDVYGTKGINWEYTSYVQIGKKGYNVYRINLETLKKGMSNNAALPYIQELRDEGDGIMCNIQTAYNLLQIAIFGEIIYRQI